MTGLFEVKAKVSAGGQTLELKSVLLQEIIMAAYKIITAKSIFFKSEVLMI